MRGGDVVRSMPRDVLLEQARTRMLARSETPITITDNPVAEIVSGVSDNTLVLPALGWRPRPYQQKAWDYFTSPPNPNKKGICKLGVMCWSRRTGKDNFLLNLIAYMTTKRKGTYWHVFPELKQGRKAIWEGYTQGTNAHRNIDYIPEQLREGSNANEMRINLATGSTYMLVGASNPDDAAGSGPIGVGFSEFALMDSDQIWRVVKPMLNANGGWACFISTPRGHNHFKQIYDFAASDPNYFAETLTVDEAVWTEDGKMKRAVEYEAIEEDRKMGFPEEWVQQEYWCSFSAAVEGVIFSKNMVEARASGRITPLPYQPHLPVFTSWDVGWRDDMVCLFFQLEPTGGINVIDCEAGSFMDFRQFKKILLSKPYQYGRHYGPHDLRQTRAGGWSSFRQAIEAGINFTILPKTGVDEGIQRCRALFPRIRFSSSKCAKLIDMLDAYRREYDESKKVYTDPRHDKSSHYADAFRYMCQAVPGSLGELSYFNSLGDESESREIDRNEPARDDQDCLWNIHAV